MLMFARVSPMAQSLASPCPQPALVRYGRRHAYRVLYWRYRCKGTQANVSVPLTLLIPCISTLRSLGSLPVNHGGNDRPYPLRCSRSSTPQCSYRFLSRHFSRLSDLPHALSFCRTSNSVPYLGWSALTSTAKNHRQTSYARLVCWTLGKPTFTPSRCIGPTSACGSLRKLLSRSPKCLPMSSTTACVRRMQAITLVQDGLESSSTSNNSPK